MEDEEFLKIKKTKLATKNEFDLFAERTSVFRDICGSFNCSLCFLMFTLVCILGYCAFLLEKGFEAGEEEAV